MTILGMYIYENPKNNGKGDEKKESTITHKDIGKRGDMGNQIFQMACIIAAGKRGGAKVILPKRVEELGVSKIFDLTRYEWRDIETDRTYYEYDNYEKIMIPEDGRRYEIKGYRQAYKYFEEEGEEIREIFKPKEEMIKEIKKRVPKEYLAVHIRRGDYIKAIHKIPLLREFRQCKIEYYRRGIIKLREEYPEYQVIVCTDSPEWVETIIDKLGDKIELAPKYEGIEGKYSDFCILYLARGVVMSNSTYSFWGAYLRNNRSIVAPTPWWNPEGFIGTAMGLDGPYLHYPEWTLMDADTGEIVREAKEKKGEREDNNHETLNIYKLVRGMIV